MYMSMTGNEKVKVKFVLKDSYGFVKGEIYNAFMPNCKIGKADVISVIDKFGEEYAYPLSWFEVITN